MVYFRCLQEGVFSCFYWAKYYFTYVVTLKHMADPLRGDLFKLKFNFNVVVKMITSVEVVIPWKLFIPPGMPEKCFQHIEDLLATLFKVEQEWSE